MIVVSNTSPLTNLAAIGHFDLLRQLYGEVHISEAVWDELNAQGVAWPGRADVERSPWVRRHPRLANELVRALRRELDPGECETIALAITLDAGLVLLDDREAREAAEYLGLHVGGVLGSLLEAKARGYLKEVRPAVDALREQAGFFISPRLYQRFLELAGESAPAPAR